MSYAADMAPDDDDIFAQAMSDVSPLADRDRVVSSPAIETPLGKASKPPRFIVDGAEGRAHGVNEKQLAKLRRGDVDIAATVDLHRSRADAARQQVTRQVTNAAAHRSRALLIIHGKGRHSAGAPVLRSVVIDTLTAGACAKHVLAFCPALPKHGGSGAMYVLLRKQRYPG